MTRNECEKKLLDLMRQAYHVFREYNPEGNHLSMFATVNGHCALGYRVAPWDSETIIDGYLSPDGCYRLSE